MATDENPLPALIENLRLASDDEFLSALGKVFDIILPSLSKAKQAELQTILNRISAHFSTVTAHSERIQSLTEISGRRFEIISAQVEASRNEDQSIRSLVSNVLPEPDTSAILSRKLVNIMADCDDHLSKLELIVPGPPASAMAPSRTSDAFSALKTLALLQDSVPKFSGDLLLFAQFREVFEQCVIGLQVPDVNKLNVLRNKLTGKMEKWLAPFLHNNVPFSDIWTALSSEFNNQYELLLAKLDQQQIIPAVDSDNPDQLQAFIQAVEAYQATVNRLKQDHEDVPDLMIFHSAIRRLPQFLHKGFYDDVVASNQPLPSTTDLLDYLRARASRNLATQQRSLPMYHSSRRTSPRHPPPNHQKASPSSYTPTFQKSQSFTSSSERLCAFCDRKHPLYQCHDFLSLPYPKRLGFCQKTLTCTNCLGGVHTVSNCRSERCCSKCEKRHHFFLHNFGPDRQYIPDYILQRFSTSTTSGPTGSLPNHKEMTKIQQKFNRAKEYGDDKVQLAIQTYELVDKHIRRLDSDLARFELEIQDKALTSSRAQEDHAANPARRGRKKLKEKEGKKKKGSDEEEHASAKSAKKKKKVGAKGDKTSGEKVAGALSASDSPLPGLPLPGAEVLDMPVDPNEPTYCLCHQVSYGEMIGCDNPDCPIEWFHFACVSLTTKPKGKWFCPKCSADRKKK